MKIEAKRTTEETFIHSVECDFCHTIYKGEGWGKDGYKKAETNISYLWGTFYPDDCNGSEIEVDICPTCFMEKLVPWMKEQGVHIVKSEFPWGSDEEI
jgi:uncharacterized protein (DUF2225 family)